MDGLDKLIANPATKLGGMDEGQRRKACAERKISSCTRADFRQDIHN
jgi:hypothetical protein